MVRTTAKTAAASGPIGHDGQWASWFFENADDLFVIIRPQGRLILAANSVWESVTGWPVAALVGRDLFELIAPEDRPALRAMRPQLAVSGVRLEPFRLMRKDGEWLWMGGFARQGPDGAIMGMFHDVTEARRRQARLDDAEQERILLAETAGVGSWRFDPRQQHPDWSPEMHAVLAKAGVGLGDIDSLMEHCHPDDVARVAKAMTQVASDGRAVAFDHRLRTADGGWMHMRVHVRGEPLGDGGYLLHGLSQDVTELAVAREAALSAQRQSRRLAEEAPFAIALFDLDLRYTMASPRWIELFKLQDRPFLGVRLDEVADGRYAEIVSIQARALAGEVTRIPEIRLVDARGNEYWLRVEVHPWRNGDGEIAGVVLYVDDISAITKARCDAQAQEQKLRIALGAARAAVIEVDYVRRMSWSSPELVELTGHDLTGPLPDALIWPFIHPLDRPQSEALIKGWLAGGPVEPQETRILTADGRERWIRIYTEVAKTQSGAWLSSVSLLIDIDESKRQQLALIEAERAAQAAAEAKSQFLANMSHEIRTPMNGVLGVLHLLERLSLPAEAEGMLAEALACGRMLQALLDDVVDFSRMEAGRLELASEALDPRAVLDGVVGLLRPQAEAKGLTVSIEAEGLPGWVSGDPVRLRQCLFNLMGNAVKFTVAGSITARASLREGPDGARLRFEFEDTGVGVEEAVGARLFERFQQADATATRRFGGSGLGLAITRRLAELMGGSVDFRSTPGEGSTFWLELPARLAPPPRAATTQAGEVLDGFRILVVEDNATNRMIATKILESLGAAVETAEDGEQGVAAAQRGGFDLILMDIQMPGIDGMEATRRIRALPGPAADTPVVALTANVLTHQCEAYRATGMNGVVGKPVSPAALLAEIARLAAEAPVSPALVACAT